jgi:MFS family permease
MIADVVPKRRMTMAVQLFSGSAAIGAAASIGLGGLLMSWALTHGNFELPVVGELRPWQMVLLLTGVPGLVFADTIFLVREPPRLDRIGQQHNNMREFFAFLRERKRYYIGHMAGFSLIQAISYGFSLWLPFYMVNKFHWDIADVGLILAACTGISFFGSSFAGWCVDWFFKRGVTDATLRWPAALIIFCTINLQIAFSTSSGLVFVIALALAQTPLSLFGIGSASLQLVTPNEFRGKVMSLYLLVTYLIGFGLGPSIPALFTDYVFHDEKAMGPAIMISTAIMAPLASLCLWTAFKPMRGILLSSARAEAG